MDYGLWIMDYGLYIDNEEMDNVLIVIMCLWYFSLNNQQKMKNMKKMKKINANKVNIKMSPLICCCIGLFQPNDDISLSQCISFNTLIANPDTYAWICVSSRCLWKLSQRAQDWN